MCVYGCVHVHVHVHVHVCMTLFHILMLTVGHDSTPKCMCMLCMTLFRVLILAVGHDSLICVCVRVRVHAHQGLTDYRYESMQMH